MTSCGPAGLSAALAARRNHSDDSAAATRCISARIAICCSMVKSGLGVGDGGAAPLPEPFPNLAFCNALRRRTSSALDIETCMVWCTSLRYSGRFWFDVILIAGGSIGVSPSIGAGPNDVAGAKVGSCTRTLPSEWNSSMEVRTTGLVVAVTRCKGRPLSA